MLFGPEGRLGSRGATWPHCSVPIRATAQHGAGFGAMWLTCQGRVRGARRQRALDRSRKMPYSGM